MLSLRLAKNFAAIKNRALIAAIQVQIIVELNQDLALI